MLLFACIFLAEFYFTSKIFIHTQSGVPNWECLHHGNCETYQIRAILLRWSMFKFTYTPLPTYHSPEISLVKVINGHKFATFNRHLTVNEHFCLLSIWPLRHIWYMWSLLSSWNAFFNWTPRLFSLLVLQLCYWSLFLIPWPIFLFL